jgi:hypothetical protein
VTPDHGPDGPHAGVAQAARWTAAPLTWRDAPGGVRARTGAALRRLTALAGGRPAAPSGPTGPPLGYLHREPGPGRLPLHSAIHPVTGDQLLTTDPWEAVDLGYGDPALLGHLEASAPVTGRLGTIRPHLPLASHFGQRVRDD